MPDAVPDKEYPRILASHVFKGSSYLIFNNLGIKETSVIPYRAPHRAPHRAPLGHRIGHLFVVPDKELLRFFNMTFSKLTQDVNRQPCRPLAPRSLCSFLCLSVGLTACLFVRQSVCPCVRLSARTTTTIKTVTCSKDTKVLDECQPFSFLVTQSLKNSRA